MTKTKKISAAILAGVMALSFAALAGCSKDKEKVVNSPDDFVGAKISVQTATTASDNLDEMKADGKKIDVYAYEKVTQCFDDLKLGRVDAVYVDSVVAAYYTSGDNAYERTWLSDVPEPMALCLKKGSDDLTAAVEAALDTLAFNGKMTEIAKKHFKETANFTDGLRDVKEAPSLPDIGGLTMKSGVLTVGMEIGYPPMEYSETGKVEDAMGFDVDTVKAIAALYGLEVKIVPTAWDGIFAGLDKGQYDIIASSVSITPEREQNYNLTKPYVANKLCIVTKAK